MKSIANAFAVERIAVFIVPSAIVFQFCTAADNVLQFARRLSWRALQIARAATAPPARSASHKGKSGKDIAAPTKSTFFDNRGVDINKNPELITKETLGTSDRFIAEFNESTIVGGEGDVQARGGAEGRWRKRRQKTVKSVSKRVSLPLPAALPS
jgi:hypothetical protein